MVRCGLLSIVTVSSAASCGASIDLGNGQPQQQTSDVWASSVDVALAKSLYEGEVDSIAVDETHLGAVLARTVPGPSSDCANCPSHVEGSIVSCRLDACAATVTTLATVVGPQAVVGGVLLSAGEVLWTTQTDNTSNVRGTLWSCPVTGCPAGPSPLCDIESFYGANLAVDAAYVYWVQDSERIMRCGRAGGAPPEEVHRATPLRVLFSNGGGDRIVLSGEDMFVSYATSGASVWRLPRDGSGDDAPVYQGSPVGGIAIATDGLYVLTQVLTGQVLRCPRAGCGDSPEVLASGGRWPDYMLVDDGGVYWASEGGVWSCPRAGCGERRLVVNGTGAFSGAPFAMNSRYLFWIEAESKGSQLLRRIKVVAK